MNETQRKRRGHNFTAPKAVLRKIPALYETDGNEAIGDKTIWLHYFGGSSDYYVAELNPETNEAFGYVKHAHMADLAEWGYFDLEELEQVRIPVRLGGHTIYFPLERDLHWQPRKFSEIKEAQK